MSFRSESAHQQESAEELPRETRLLQILLKIESEILRAESPEAIADVALKNILRIIPCSASAITLFRRNYSETVILTEVNMPFETGGIVEVATQDVAAHKRGEPLLITDLTAQAERTPGVQLALDAGAHSLLSVPLIAHEELLGTIALFDKAPGAFTEEEIAITQQVGNPVAIALHSARLLEKERKARQEADTLQQIASIISAGMGQEELLDLILKELERVLAYDRASIMLNEGDRYSVAAYRGPPMSLTELSFRSGQMLPNIKKVIEEQRPQISADTERDPDWRPLPGGKFIRSWMGIPLATKSGLLGLLMLDKAEPFYYSEEDASLALAFANHAVIAIENANLYREIRQYATGLETQIAKRTRDLAALYEVTAITARHLELQETFDQIITVVIETMNCTATSIHLLDKAGSTLHLAAHRGLAAAVLAYLRELPASLPEIKPVLEKQQTMIYDRRSVDQELANVPLPETFTHGIATVIRIKEQSVGVLGVGYQRPEPPTREDVALLTSIADHIGVAIENTRLRELSEQSAALKERERLEQELHDSATQSLFALTLFADAAREHLAAGDYAAVEQELAELEKTAVQTHKEMRLLLYELRPDILVEEGLEEALRQRMQMVESRGGIRGETHFSLPGELPFSVQEVLFLVASEALNNTLKHSGADEVLIVIQLDGNQIEMRISDNGRGFSPMSGTFTMGMGMNIMRQRLEAMNGTIRYESEPEIGTLVIARVPLEPQNERS